MRNRFALTLVAVTTVITVGLATVPAVAAEPKDEATATLRSESPATYADAPFRDDVTQHSIQRSATNALGRPVLQALSQYRSGDRTFIQIASIVPVANAAEYRLERADSVNGTWAHVGNCVRVCRVILYNPIQPSTVVFRMRAVGRDGSLSVPSVALGVTPIRWQDRAHPGARLTYRMGPLSAGIVGKSFLGALIRLTPQCGFDEGLRKALSASVEPLWQQALKQGAKYSRLSAIVAIAAEEYYKLLFNSHCDLAEDLFYAVKDSVDRVDTQINNSFHLQTTWKSSWDTGPALWICDVDTVPYVAENRIDVTEPTCLNFAYRFWSVYGE